MGEIGHIFVLIWRNFKIKIRHPWLILIEYIIPVLCLSILILIQDTSRVEISITDTIYQPYDIDIVPNKNLSDEDTWGIFYAPQSVFLDKVMNDTAKKLDLIPSGFDTENDLIQAYLNSTSVIVAGIIFDTNLVTGINSTEVIKYRIRPETLPDTKWNIENLFPRIPVQGLRNRNSLWGTDYMTLGFLPVQHAVSMHLMQNSFLDSKADIYKMFRVQMQRFPFPPYKLDTFYFKPEYFFTYLICLGFLYPFANLTRNIVSEKEKGLKGALKIMGVSNWMNWAAWYFSSLLNYCLLSGITTVLVCTQILKNRAIFHNSSYSLCFLWLVLYSASLISFSCFISTLFHSRNSALCAAFILFFLTLVPYMHMIAIERKITMPAMVVSFLFPNTILGYSTQIWIRGEALGYGLRWKNLHTIGAESLGISMSKVFYIFIGEAVLYLILAWYIEAVFPGKYQEPQPWYFPVTATYWIGSKRQRIEAGSFGMHEIKPELFEKDPYGIRPAIELKNLCKSFQKEKQPTVKNVSLKAYFGQITVLLGHFGSGKSTLVSLMLGKCRPTSGDITIMGSSVTVANEARKIPRILGFCPDHDITYDDLTVKENLYFYCKIKGFQSEGIKSQIEHILSILDLEIRNESYARDLPYSWRRKLCIGTALIGGSEVVIIDEPTSQMDSYSRRIVWNALKTEHDYRTFFITSSHMKEASAIGDKIGVMDGGELQCCGSIPFLRNIYGAGYELTVEQDAPGRAEFITKLVLSRIPEAKVNTSEDKLRYILPYNKSNSFYLLFHDLEDKKAVLKINKFTVSEVSMENLFDKVSFSMSADCTPISSKDILEEGSSSPIGTNEEIQNLLFLREQNESFCLFCQQALALLKKQCLFSFRYKVILALQILVLPLIFISSSAFTSSEVSSNASIKLDLASFDTLNIPMKVQYAIDPSRKMSQALGDMFISSLPSPKATFFVNSLEETMNEHLLELARENLHNYHSHNMIAVDISEDGNETSFIAFYNNKAIHSSPISLLYVHNTILKYITRDKNLSDSFEVTNNPLPLKHTFAGNIFREHLLFPSFLIAEDLIFGFSILMASFAIFVVLEKSSKFKQLQIISGLNTLSYWFMCLVHDFIIYSVCCLLLLLVLWLTGVHGFSNPQMLGYVSVLFLSHGVAGLIFVYLCSFFSKVPSKAFIFLFLYHMFGLILQLTISWLETYTAPNMAGTLDTLFSLFLPCYCLAKGFSNLSKNFKNNQLCNNIEMQISCKEVESSSGYFELLCCKDKCGEDCIKWEEYYLSWTSPGIGKQIIFTLVQTVIFSILILLLEMKLFSRLKFKLQRSLKAQLETPNDQEEKVRRKCNTILNACVTDYHIVARKVTKFFGAELVICNLTFGVKKGEFFGLIGTDEAGKSIALKIITGELPMTSGEVYIEGKNIEKEPKVVRGKVGVCPETAVLLDYLTGEETLQLYASLRGIPKEKIPLFIHNLSTFLALNYYLKKKIQEFSFCAKRKLSIAIALIGTPPLIILDQPSLQIDPPSCRCIWNTLLQASNHGCTILISSDRMDEAEAVCHQIGIIALGKLIYLGDLAELKKEFDGFTLYIRIKTEKLTHMRSIARRTAVDEAKILVEDVCPEAILKADFANSLSYFIPDRNIKLSKIFASLEEAKGKLYIDEYSFSRTTLDHVLFHETIERNEKNKNIVDYIKERREGKW